MSSPAMSRRCDPPAAGKGKPPGIPPGEWTIPQWTGVLVDFDKLDALAATSADVAVVKVRPDDATFKTTRLKRPYSQPNTDGTATWAKDACAYCFYRARAPASCPAGHADHWWYGTGDGAHNPYRCQPCKRYLAEGGDVARQPEWSAHLQSCLYVAPPRRQQA